MAKTVPEGYYLGAQELMTQLIDWLESLYGYDEKTIRRHLNGVLRYSFLGIARGEDGRPVVEGIPGVVGPWPAKSTKILLPSGTMGACIRPVSGEVNAAVYMDYFSKQRNRSVVGGYAVVSGALGYVITHPPWPVVQTPTWLENLGY